MNLMLETMMVVGTSTLEVSGVGTARDSIGFDKHFRLRASDMGAGVQGRS